MRTRFSRIACSFAAALTAMASQVSAQAASLPEQLTQPETKGNVIFIHPDGASAATWTVGRAYFKGPDGQLNWDMLPNIAVYAGHLRDSLTGTSNGGATMHAYGTRVFASAFGKMAGSDEAPPILDANGRDMSVALQAVHAGIKVALVQSGTITEPGTGAFVAPVASRRMHNEIAVKTLESGAHIILGGGEQFFLPEGVEGVYGPGSRTDGRNLLEEARARGFTVVRTREELLALSPSTPKVLGLFAYNHTFNDEPEEVLAQRGLPLYNPEAPTIGEMTRVALDILEASGEQFLVVVEEEGTDNFGNNNNAIGTITAMGRADAAIGVAREHVARNPNTLVVTCADSDGGGMRMMGLRYEPGDTLPKQLAPRISNGAPIDGVAGTATAPFLAAPDRFGIQLPFMVVWSAYHDVSGGVLVRAEGKNAHLVRGTMHSADIGTLIRITLFGENRPPVQPQAVSSAQAAP